jgi:protein-S-isoprenylcysteine O-methyltransferase Ste14
MIAMTNPTIVLVSASAVWVGWEIWLVVRDRKQGKGSTGADRGTRYLNFIAMIAGIGGAACTSAIPTTFFPGGRTETTLWIGIVIMAVGLLLRIWAVLTLGASFRTTVETHAQQKVVDHGPYRLIRHPSYTGLLLTCCGYGIAVQNWISLGLAVILPLIALVYRMHIEERVLSASIGQSYSEYMKRTKRLIPFLW